MRVWRWVLLAGLAATPAVAQMPDDAVALRPWWGIADFAGVEDIEKALFRSTNEERRKAGLSTLLPMTALQVAARQHSQEMLREDYFSHQSPHAVWSDPSRRAYRAGFWEAFVGENIVYLSVSGYEVSNAEVAREFMYGDHGWMNSPPHKANIMNRDYTHLGLGVASRNGTTYATQVFGRPTYEVLEAYLRPVGSRLEVSGRATLVTTHEQVHVACDDELVETIQVSKGQTFRFKVTVPKDGGRHRVGLHPNKGEGSYWIKYLFHLDTAQPPASMLAMPVDD